MDILDQSLDDSINLNDLLIPEVCIGHTALSALDVSDNRKCRYCFKDFDSKEACQVHLEEHRGDDKPYKCPHEGCDSSFKARKNLKDHYLGMLGIYQSFLIIKNFHFQSIATSARSHVTIVHKHSSRVAIEANMSDVFILRNERPRNSSMTKLKDVKMEISRRRRKISEKKP